MTSDRSASSCRITHNLGYSTVSRLSLGWLACPVGPRDIASGRAQQKTPSFAADVLRTTWQLQQTHRNIASRSCFIVVWRHCCLGNTLTVPLPSNMAQLSANMSQYLVTALRISWKLLKQALTICKRRRCLDVSPWWEAHVGQQTNYQSSGHATVLTSTYQNLSNPDDHNMNSTSVLLIVLYCPGNHK
jgi:hypothetical protein